MLASEVNSADYSDSRLDAMSDVLDSVDIKEGVKTLFRTMITPFAQEKDWAMIAEWNANSIIGCFERHLEQCNNSLDKTMKLMENAIREDVGNEISKLNVDKLIFRRDAQQLNINRAETIVNELHLAYEVAFEKKFIPKSKQAGAVKDVRESIEFVESFDNIVLCFDNDKAGRQASRNVARILKPGKVKIMTLPNGYKDANDMLKQKDFQGFTKAWWESKTYTPSGIMELSSKKNDWLKREVKESIAYPWEGLNKKLYVHQKLIFYINKTLNRQYPKMRMFFLFLF